MYNAKPAVNRQLRSRSLVNTPLVLPRANNNMIEYIQKCYKFVPECTREAKGFQGPRFAPHVVLERYASNNHVHRASSKEKLDPLSCSILQEQKTMVEI